MGYVGGSGAGGTGGSNTVTWPAGVQPGDLAFLFAAHNSVRTFTTPSGFTQVDMTTDGSCESLMWLRTCDGTETGTLTLNDDGTGSFSMVLYVVRGFVGIDAASTSARAASSTSHDCPAATPTSADVGVLVVCTERLTSGTTNGTAPAGFATDKVQFGSTGSGSCYVGVASDGLVTSRAAGVAVDPGSWTSLVSASDGVARTILLEPAAPAGITGSGAAAGAAGTAAGAGAMSTTGSGTAAAPAGVAAGAGTSSTTGAGAATSAAGAAAGAASATAQGAGTATAPTGEADGAGTATTTGAGAATAPPGAASGTSAAAGSTTGTGAATAPDGAAAGAGVVTVTGAGAAAGDHGAATGAAETSVAGAGDAAGPDAEAAATGQASTTGAGTAVAPAGEAAGDDRPTGRDVTVLAIVDESRHVAIVDESRTVTLTVLARAVAVEDHSRDVAVAVLTRTVTIEELP